MKENRVGNASCTDAGTDREKLKDIAMIHTLQYSLYYWINALVNLVA